MKESEGKWQMTWEGLRCNKHEKKFIVFYGEGGALELEGSGSCTVFDAQDKELGKFGSPGAGENEHIVNMLDAICNDKPLSLNGEIAEGHKSTLLCHLGNLAHRTGRVLKCDASNGHIVGDDEAMKLWRREYEPGWEPKV